MKKKQNFKKYLQKSFIQYAMVLIASMALLVIGFFLFYGYATVIRKNEIGNRTFSQMFEKEYLEYETNLVEISKNADVRDVVQSADSVKKRRVSSKLYEFSNNRDIRAYFLVLDSSGKTVLSNFTKSNQENFEDSLFFQRIKSRLAGQKEETIGQICDVEFTFEQSVSYSFARAVLDEDDAIIGYVFFNMRKTDLDDYASKTNEDILILDRFDNAVFSSFPLPKDPEYKLPARRFAIELENNGVYEVSETKMYVRKHHFERKDIDIYTLTSMERVLEMMRMAVVFFLLMIASMGILMLLMTRVFMRSNERGLRDLMRDLEVKNLEEQFKPHFVYNVMESIRFQIGEDPAKAQEMLLAFSTLMRYSINHGQTKVRLETDIDYLNDFLMLQKLRYNNRLTYEFQIPDELLDCRIPKLLMQPIVENSIKHGFVAERGLHIIISAKQTGEDIVFTVWDNGKGIAKKKRKEIYAGLRNPVVDDKIEHIGLYNVKKILEMLYGEKSGFEIQSSLNGGTKVTIRLPYEWEDEDV